MKNLNTIFKKTHLALAAMLCGVTMSYAQLDPVVQVPASCNVVVAGTGGVTGLGGKVGNGGIVTMPDSFDDATAAGNFTYIAGTTTLSGWKLLGDLSVQTGTTYDAAVQSAGAVTPLNIESYNKKLRFAENPSAGQPLLNTKWARSKGRVIASYTGLCGGSIMFDVLKTYTNIAPSAVPPIVGPDCVLPNSTYTYSVDQIASDNADDAIGFDKYYWNFPAGFPVAYYSADKSSITFTTGNTVPATFTLTCCYGRANTWDGDASGAHTTCVTKTIGAKPVPPTFTTPPPTCLNTGVTSFSVAILTGPDTAGYTYTWAAPGTTWTLTPSGSQSGQNLSVTGIDNNPGTLTLTITNGSCTPEVFTYPINRNFVSPFAITGNTCISGGNTYGYSVPANASFNQCIWTAPAGWTVTPTNGASSAVNIMVPISATAGAYVITVKSNSCPGVISLTVNVRPGGATISGPACVTLGTTPVTTFSCTAVPQATAYTWSLPPGWTCSAGCTTTNPTFIPTGTTAGPVTVSVTAIGTGGCSGNASSFTVNYNPVKPNSITTSCWSVGVAGSTTVTVGNAPSPFSGTYTVTCSPNTLYSGYTVSSTGVITLNTLATAPAGTYNLTITHTTASCGSLSTTFPVTVAGNGATMAINVDSPGAGNCDQYSVNNRPVGSTLTWFVDGVAVTSNGVTVSILGNTLTLCGNNAEPQSICVNVAVNGCTTRLCLTQPVAGSHSAKQANAGTTGTTIEGVTIYPNPNNGNFFINVASFKKSANATLTDNSGKQIGTYTLVKGDNKIQIEGVAKGMYIVSLVVDGKTESRKIIIE